MPAQIYRFSAGSVPPPWLTRLDNCEMHFTTDVIVTEFDGQRFIRPEKPTLQPQNMVFARPLDPALPALANMTLPTILDHNGTMALPQSEWRH
jgi:hypothetical protein